MKGQEWSSSNDACAADRFERKRLGDGQTRLALLTVKRECETHSVGNDLDPGLKRGPCTAQIG